MPMSQLQGALEDSPLDSTNSLTEALSGTRAITRPSEPTIIGACASPKVTCGRELRTNPAPRM